MKIQKTDIRDPLLRCAIDGTPHGLSHIPEIEYKHCWNYGKLRFGHVYLTFITRMVFNLHRLPGYGERCFSKIHIQDREFIEKIFDCIKEEDIRKSVDELSRLYSFTQQQLKNSGIFNSKIRLYRGLSLNYSSLYLCVKERLENWPGEFITIETDTIDSYALRNGYRRDVTIVRDVDTEDILFCDLTVSSLKEDEWLIINRNPEGLIVLEDKNISVDHNEYNLCILEKHKNSNKKRMDCIYEETRLNLFDPGRLPDVEDTTVVKVAKFISALFCKKK